MRACLELARAKSRLLASGPEGLVELPSQDLVECIGGTAYFSSDEGHRGLRSIEPTMGAVEWVDFFAIFVLRHQRLSPLGCLNF